MGTIKVGGDAAPTSCDVVYPPKQSISISFDTRAGDYAYVMLYNSILTSLIEIVDQPNVTGVNLHYLPSIYMSMFLYAFDPLPDQGGRETRGMRL